jgi:hypothetical protein
LSSFIFIVDMPTQITISTLSGSTPFDVYTCDTGYTTCIYISTITSGQVPYSFDLPFIQEGMASVGIKVVDNNSCIIESNIVI